jgi:hypothetical protein
MPALPVMVRRRLTPVDACVGEFDVARRLGGSVDARVDADEIDRAGAIDDERLGTRDTRHAGEPGLLHTRSSCPSSA